MAATALGANEEALLAFDRGLDIEPDHTGLLGNRALARIAAGDDVAALRDLDRAVELQPQGVELWFCKAVAHLRLRQLRPARHALLFAARRTWARGGSRRAALGMLAISGALRLLLRVGVAD